MDRLEDLRIGTIRRFLASGGNSVLEVGARFGKITHVLCGYFKHVTALDLEKPKFELDRVVTVAGDVRSLPFRDDEFDCILCTEVLEHVPGVEAACAELTRVARHEIIVGVPYKQDLRLGQLTCAKCGTVNPGWGHVNSFDEARLGKLFKPWRIERIVHTGSWKSKTSGLAAWLMRRGGNPWGSYGQEEPCGKCGERMMAPPKRGPMQKIFSKAGYLINKVHWKFVKPTPIWVHIKFVPPENEDEKLVANQAYYS